MNQQSLAPSRLIPCRVRVTTRGGEQHRYDAMFRNTVQAAMDAIRRFGLAKVSVEAIKQSPLRA